MSMLYCMCQLKNNTNGKTGNNSKNQEPYQPTSKDNSLYRKSNKKKKKPVEELMVEDYQAQQLKHTYKGGFDPSHI